jgi:hypothetical protein
LGCDHTYGDTLIGDFVPEGEEDQEEETTQIEQRKEQMWVVTMESIEIVWSFLHVIGVPGNHTNITEPHPHEL